MAGFINFMPATFPRFPIIPEIPLIPETKAFLPQVFPFHPATVETRNLPPVHIPHKYSLPHQRQHLPDNPDHPRDSRQFPIQKLSVTQFPYHLIVFISIISPVSLFHSSL